MRYRRKIMYAILMFTFIPSLLLGTFYLIDVWNTKVNDNLGKNRIALSSGTSGIHDLFNQNIQKINNVISSSQLALILTTEYDTSIGKTLEVYKNLKDIFDALNYNTDTSNGNGIVVYAYNPSVPEGDYIADSSRLDPAIKAEVERTTDLQIVWKYRVISDIYTRNFKNPYICLYRKVFSLDEDLGIAEVRIPFNKVAAPLTFPIPQGSFILYVSNDGASRMVVNRNQVDDAGIAKAEEQYARGGKLKSYYTIEQDIYPGVVSDRAILFVPKSQILHGMTNFILIALTSICMFFVTAYFLVKAISTILTRQLSMLIQKTNKDIGKLIASDEIAIVSMNGNDEFSIIDHRINQLIRQIKEYYHKLLHSEMGKKSLEVDLLQSLINPHFLYNTLSAIKYVYSDRKLWEFIDSMVKYYRIVLSKGEKIIAVSREIEMIAEYVKLQKFAHDTDFQCTIDVEEIKDCYIIKNLLQPIVENAFLHGISGMGPEGVIRISGRLVDGRVVMEVADNGAGIEQEELEPILAGDNLDLAGGYGIKNIQKRIKTHYGDDYGMHISSAVMVGTTVTIVIPAVYDADSEDKQR